MADPAYPKPNANKLQSTARAQRSSTTRTRWERYVARNLILGNLYLDMKDWFEKSKHGLDHSLPLFAVRRSAPLRAQAGLRRLPGSRCHLRGINQHRVQQPNGQMAGFANRFSLVDRHG